MCVTLGCIFPSCRPLRDKSAEIPAQPFDVLLCVMMATAALCMAGKSPLVHVFRLCSSLLSFFPFQPPVPPPLFFLISSSSPPPSFWSIWSIARKPGNQSGRFLLGTTVLLFFLSQFAAALCRAVLHSSEHKNWARIGSSYAKVLSLFN